MMGRMKIVVAGTALLVGIGVSIGQTPAPAPAPVQQHTVDAPGQKAGQAPDQPAVQVPAGQTPAQSTAQATATTSGGTIHGTVKAGNVPLPGVAITATNTLTGKKFATTTDIDGNYSMTIPATGRYVVRAELAAFAPVTHEVRLTTTATEGTAEFALELASRHAAEAQAAGQRVARAAQGLGRGTQALTGNSAEEGLEDATTNPAANGTGSVEPSLGLGGAAGFADATESVAVQGQQGSMNGLANLSEDQLRDRTQSVIDQVRAQGGLTGDQQGAVVSLIQGIMGGGGGFGGPGGPGGRGSRGGGGGGGGAFRNFNPAQPHGSIFYQGGNNALDSAPWQPSLIAQVNPAAYQNRFGLSIAGSPYIPGLTKPDTRQFMFINLTGQKNLNAFAPLPVRVPTALERMGDFSQSEQVLPGTSDQLQPVTIYNPVTGLPYAGNRIPACTSTLTQGCITPQAMALLNAYYPLPNINVNSTDPTVLNYQTISNAGSNNVAINTRYQRQLGQQTGTGPFGRGGGGFRGQRQNQNAPPVLRQNINASYNYSHSASDNRNIFLPLGGRTESDGNALNLGYVVSYGRLSNNASVNWNRLGSETSNYFTDTNNNPVGTVGISVPNQASNFADPRFYNGLPSISISPFQGLSTFTPSETINQTIAFSDFVAWRHKRHNLRFGGDIRRVHNDVIGGNNPLGSFTFSGYATSSPSDQIATNRAGQYSGSGFADFLLGLPQSTSIQAGIYKDYLRENVYDWYATDDWRMASNITLNYGVRYEYFGPYSEKDGHLVNLDHNANFTAVDTVLPGQNGTYGGKYPSALVNPDRLMYAPRLGGAWSPKYKWTKNVVVRGGYGVNYNTGQYATFAQKLSRQAPFSVTQNNTIQTATSSTVTGCITISPTHPTAVTNVNGLTTLTLANGFNCSTALTINNNWAVDKNYRLGNVQIYNLNIQKTLGAAIVMNVGYNGSKGSNLDTVGTPNGTPAVASTITGVAPFDYEESAAGLHSNSLVVSVQQRQRKGIALGATYTYLHSIDNASGVGGAVGTPVQNFYRLDLEEGNSAFDQRHNLTGNYLIELPFGPNREYLNKGGVMAKVLDGFSISGSFTFATGNYFTPTYSGNEAEATAANTFNERPDRDYTQTSVGPGKVKQFFNTAAFSAPASGQYGTASQGAIEGPGTVSVNTALSRTVQLGGTSSFEARVQATNVFNTVQYSSINTTENSSQFGQVTSAAAMRALVFIARYRF
jgi:hypothetical protein